MTKPAETKSEVTKKAWAAFTRRWKRDVAKIITGEMSE